MGNTNVAKLENHTHNINYVLLSVAYIKNLKENECFAKIGDIGIGLSEITYADQTRTDFHRITLDEISEFDMPFVDLLRCAYNNTRGLCDVSFSAEDSMPAPLPSGEPVYHLTDKLYIAGSAVILLKDLQEEIANKLGGSYYILPLSVRDLVIVKVGAADVKMLKDVLSLVNKSGLIMSEEDLLSEHIFVYNRNTGILSMIE